MCVRGPMKALKSRWIRGAPLNNHLELIRNAKLVAQVAVVAGGILNNAADGQQGIPLGDA